MLHTIIAKQELVLNTEDSHWTQPLLLAHEIQRRISRIKQALCIEGLEVDNLEPIGASDAKSGLEEVNGT